MEVWVNGVVVETAVSSHYKKTLLWNKIDNDEEYKCTDVFVKCKSSWVQPRLTKIFPSLGYVSLDNKWIFHVYFSDIQVWFIVYCSILRFENQNQKTCSSRRIEILKQSKFFSDHKLSILSRHLSQVNMTGICLSHKLNKSVPKHPHLGPEVQIHSLDWALGTGTEFPTPYKISFLIMFTTELGNNIFTWCNKLFCWCSACMQSSPPNMSTEHFGVL